VLLAALGFRLLAQAGFDEHPRSFAPLVDSEAYLLQALRVADGEPLVAGVTFQAPLYPWLLGWTLRLSGVPGVSDVERLGAVPPKVVARAVAVGQRFNHALGLALVLLLWRVGRALFSPAAGLWAAGLAALSSPFVYYEGHLLKVSLSLLVLPLAVLLAQRALGCARARAWIWVGLCLGLGGMVRGNMYLLAWGGAALLVLAGLRARRLRSGLAGAAWLVLGLGLALSPLVLRNSLVAGHPVWATAAGGTAFFLCNHAGNDTGLIEHTALNRQVPRYEQRDWQAGAERALGRTLNAAEVSQHWMGAALDDIRAGPGRWLTLELRKLGLLFSRYEAPDNTLVALGEAELPLLARTPSRWELVLPLALVGLALAWRQRGGRRQEQGPGPGGGSHAEHGDERQAGPASGRAGGRAVLVWASVGYGASLAVFIVTSRFRMPLEPLGMLWAGFALASLPAILREPLRTRLALAAWLVLGLLLGRMSEGPLGPLDRRELASHLSVRYLNRAVLAREQGDLPAARADLDQAARVAHAVQLAAPAVLVEQATLDRAEALRARAAGDAAAAQAALKLAGRRLAEALRLSSDHGPARRLTGLLAYDAGRCEQASAHFEGALAAVPGDREARQYLCLSLLELQRWGPASAQARQLIDAAPEDEVGHGLLALALLGAGDQRGAQAALESYDRLASMRDAAGLVRRLPEQPAFSRLRSSP